MTDPLIEGHAKEVVVFAQCSSEEIIAKQAIFKDINSTIT